MIRMFRSLGLSCVAAAVASACGGGGGIVEGPQNSIVKFEVLPSQSAFMMAGDALPLLSTTETFGPKVKSMKWTSAAAGGYSLGSLTILDPECSQGEYSSREVPGSPSLNVGTGKCETRAIASADATGVFTITGLVTGTDNSQRTEHISVSVFARPKLDYSLAVRSEGPVRLNSPIRLTVDPSFENTLPSTARIEYAWSVLLGPGIISGPANEREALTVLSQPGKYIFLCTATVTNGAEVVSRSAATSLAIGESDAVSSMGFSVDAQANQAVVAVGTPLNLTASYSVLPGTTVDSVEYKWKQIPGQSIMSADNQRSIYVMPTAPGPLVFLVEVKINAGGIYETLSKVVSVTAYRPN